jgi:hypothetical protein
MDPIQAFPKLYLWTAYPVMALLRQLWTSAGDATSISPYTLEWAALLERILSYYFTGQARVLVKSSMEPLFITYSLLAQGLVTIREDSFRQSPFRAVPINWPSRAGIPAIPSKSSQMRHFDKPVYEVSSFSCPRVVIRAFARPSIRADTAAGARPSVRACNMCMPSSAPRARDLASALARRVCDAWHPRSRQRCACMPSQLSHHLTPHIQAYHVRFLAEVLEAHFQQNKRHLTITDERRRLAVLLAELVMTGFKADCRTLVGNGVQKRLEGLDEDDPRQRCFIAKTLKSWLKQDTHLLAYNNSAYKELLQLVVEDESQFESGLPGMSVERTDHDAFAKQMVDMVVGKKTIGRPLVRDGACYQALKVVVPKIMVLANVAENDRQQKFTCAVLAQAMDLANVRFAPWSPPPSGPGRPSIKPVHDYWISLGAPPKAPRGDLDPGQVAAHAMHLSEQSMVAADGNAAWRTSEFEISDMRKLLLGAKLPNDFRTAPQSSGYILDAFDWVQGAYDYRKATHRLVLFMAIIVSRALPAIHAPAGDILKDAGDEASTLKLARELPWVERPNQKGTSDRSAWIAMFVTFVLSMIERASPVHKHIEAAAAEHPKKNGDIAKLLSKCSQYSTPFAAPGMKCLRGHSSGESYHWSLDGADRSRSGQGSHYGQRRPPQSALVLQEN